jgi:predicted nucleic acid-binding protein
VNAVFADTAFYVAALSIRDELHSAAISFLAAYEGRTVSTEFVLVEVANFCSAIGKRTAFVELVRGRRSSPRTQIVPSSQDLFERGLELFEARHDKDWSLTDCMSFVVMIEQSITDALASDRHFAQAGFRTLLSQGA